MPPGDRGGLTYPIIITLDSKGAEQFRAEIEANNAAWETFRANLAGVGAGSAEIRNLAAEMRKLASASERLAATSQQSAQATSEVTTAAANQTSAAAAVVRATNEAAAASTRRAKALTIEEEATKRIARAERERAVAAELANRGRTPGGSADFSFVKRFDAEEEAQKRLLKVERERLVTQQLASRGLDPRGKTPAAAATEEAIAAERIAKAMREARIEEALRLQGRSRTGAQLPQVFGPTRADLPAVTDQQRAQTQFDASLQRLRINALRAELEKASPEFRKLSGAMVETDSVAVRLAGTVGRLVGVLALFLAARAVAGGIGSLVSGAVEFNAKLESATNRVATLLTAIGQVRDAQGKIVTGAEAFAITSGIATKQVQALQLSAAQAGTSFETMLEVLQQATGPGLAAGLNTDQIQKFSVAFSAAATTMGLQTRELSEEVRALLGGGAIRPSQTRVATLLGIGEKDIADLTEGVNKTKAARSEVEKEIDRLHKKRRLNVDEASKLSNLLQLKLQQDLAKQAASANSQGKLFEFLTAKLEAFEKAQPLTAKSFDRLEARAAGAVQQLLGAGGAGLFVSLKGLLDDVGSAILKITEAGTRLEINPGAVVVVQALASGLATAVDEARLLLRELSPSDFFESAKLLGNALAVTAKVLAGLILGFVRGINDVAFVVNQIAGLIGEVFEPFADLFPEASFEKIVALLTEIGVLVLAAKAATILWGVATTGVLTAIEGIAAILAVLTTPAALLVALFVALAVLANKIKTEVFGVEAPFKRLLDIGLALSIQLFGAFLKLKDLIISSFTEVGLFMKTVFAQGANALIASFTGALSDLIGTLAEAARKLGFVELAEKLEGAQAAVLKAANASLQANAKVIRDTEASINKAREDREQGQAAADRKTEEAVSKALDGDKKLSDVVGGVLEGFSEGFQDAAKRLREELKEFNGKPAPKGTVGRIEAGEPIPDNVRITELVREPGDLKATGGQSGGIAVQFDVPASVQSANNLVNSLMSEVFRPFGLALSDVITSALDPNSKIDVKKRFKDALSGIPLALLQTVFGVQPRQGAGAIGFASGGEVPQHAFPSLAHFAGARGFQAGGPPAGVDSRDTVPIWTQAGEWVIQLASVARYGHDTMAAINAGLVDPTALRALAGTRRAAVRSPKLPGFALGGAVPTRFSTGSSGEQTEAGGRIVGAVIVANNQQAARLFEAGHEAFLSHLERNAPSVRARLGL